MTKITGHSNMEGLNHTNRSMRLACKAYPIGGTITFRYSEVTPVYTATVVSSDNLTLSVLCNGREIRIFKSMVVEVAA